MPFKSKKQRGFMHANEPEIADKWEKEYKKGGSTRRRKKRKKDKTLSPSDVQGFYNYPDVEDIGALKAGYKAAVEKFGEEKVYKPMVLREGFDKKEFNKKYPGVRLSEPEWDKEFKSGLFKKGGKTNGPSHKDGGIDINVEGGEYIIKKDSVNAETEPVLEKINNTGTLSYKCGGKIPHYDARNRRKRRK